MQNQLKNVTVQIQQLSPYEAELWIVVEAEQITPTTEVRGKVHGPRCPGIATIEVAYPLRLVAGETPFTNRVVIPDPNLWSPDKPFVYRAIVELWEDDAKCAEREVEIGLRMKAIV